MTCKKIIKDLKALANPANVAGMARYGINSAGTLGVPTPVLRKTAKAIGRRHDLALTDKVPSQKSMPRPKSP